MAVHASPNSEASGLCPQCGCTVSIASDAAALLRQAREQIQALESQVALLDQKAAAAIDRWADYEDELTQLRRQLSAANGPGAKASRSAPTISPPAPGAASASTPVTPISPTRTSFLPTGAANRLSALLSPRPAKSTPNLAAAAAATAPPPPQHLTAIPTPPPSATNNNNKNNTYDYMQPSAGAYPSSPAAMSPPPRTPQGSFPFFGSRVQTPPQQQQPQAQDSSPSTKELLDALTREQKLRRAAEGRLQDTSREVEELSVSLFEQANEMVAEERRARARLEARVAVLEQRDTEKKRRLERLELAMDRIERLRAILGDSASNSASTSPTATAASMSRLTSKGQTRTVQMALPMSTTA